MDVLVTGGAGYIGSTVCSALIDAGHTPVIVDSLVTGRIEFTRGRVFYHGDVADDGLLRKVLSEHPRIECAIHLAALIVVPDSVKKPYEYYTENVTKSIAFFKGMIDGGVHRIVFSSTAAMYDDVPGFYVTEDSPLNPRSPYSKTKYMTEQILSDFCGAYDLRAISLRYFNLIGADPLLRSGLQSRAPSHLLGKLVSVAKGEQDKFTLTGTDWPTRDGTGLRDYIHVWDVARAHVLAVERFDRAAAGLGCAAVAGDGAAASGIDVDAAGFDHTAASGFGAGFVPINLGCGRGVTVREFVAAFEKVYGKKVPMTVAPPRLGDVAGAYAGAGRAAELLGWKTELSIEDGIADALKWFDERNRMLPT